MGRKKKIKKPDLPKIPDKHRLSGKKAKIGLLAEADRILETYREYAKKDFMIFALGLKIDSAEGPKVFNRCIYPFQKKFFEDVAPNLHDLRIGEDPKNKRFWTERTKKAGKDSDLAIIILWLVAFPERPFYIQVAAADKEQASIVKKRIVNLIHYNSWLENYVDLVQWGVRSKKKLTGSNSPMSSLDIMSSHIEAAHGGTPDLLIINELSHVRKWEFVENLMHNASGVPRGMVIIATNAGFKGTKAEVWRNNATNPNNNWVMHCWSKPAPWHSEEFIADEKRRSTPSQFNRLWKGRWASGKGDALDEEDIEKCFEDLDGLSDPETGWIYIAGLDLSIKNDRTGLVVLGINIAERKIKTAYWKQWSPSKITGEVNLIDVEGECIIINKLYNIQGFYYDPSEARLMAQQLRPQVPMIEMGFTPKNCTLMAESLIQAVESKILQCYDDEKGTLKRDISKFNIVEKPPSGYKLEAVRDEYGHADVGTALVICLPRAVAYLDGNRGLGPDDVLVDTNEEELSEEEIENLPDELRGIYGMYDDRDEDQLFEKDWDVLE